MPLPYHLIGMFEVMSSSYSVLLLGAGVKVLFQLDAQLLAQGRELLEVLLVLLLILDLGLDTCWKPVSISRDTCVCVCLCRWTLRTLEDPHGGGEVVDPPGGLKCGGADAGRGDKIVGEGVV